VTVILLIVGHRPVFHACPGGELLCPPQTAPRLRTNRDLGSFCRVACLFPALRLFQLSRPGHLSGFAQYDDGVYFGNAVRLVHPAIAYRDFATVQPPGSRLLMTPVALAASRARGLELTGRPEAVR
jgi:hypothetical protein